LLSLPAVNSNRNVLTSELKNSKRPKKWKRTVELEKITLRTGVSTPNFYFVTAGNGGLARANAVG
jgi:hypothetical protein